MKKIFQPLLLLAVLFIQQSHKSIDQRPPNIVVIFMDDMGYGDISCNGALDIYTPVMDKLANKGMRFTNFMSAQAVCSASRASLLTGCYANRVGISGALMPNSKIGLSHDETTIAELLKQRKYATGIFGKWHLGDAPEFLPLNQGFDEYLGIPYSNDMWPVDFDGTPAKVGTNKANYPPLAWIKNNERVESIQTLEDQSLITSRITDASIQFIKKNKNKPFFLYMPSPMPHVPINASKNFRGKSKEGLYGDVIQEIDYSIGRIVKTLEQEGLDKNTLVIITSDNGPWLNFGNHAGNTGGFREGKGASFEGGQRVPCIMYWNGVIPAGVVCNQLSSTLDILPTIAHFTGTTLPNKKIDGVDLSGILKGDINLSPRKTFLYYYRRNALEAVREGNWKLVFDHPARSYMNKQPGKDGFPATIPEDAPVTRALYDLRRDPGEQYDVQASFPDVVKRLEVLAEEARADLGDDLQQRAGANRREPGRVNVSKK